MAAPREVDMPGDDVFFGGEDVGELETDTFEYYGNESVSVVDVFEDGEGESPSLDGVGRKRIQSTFRPMLRPPTLSFFESATFEHLAKEEERLAAQLGATSASTAEALAMDPTKAGHRYKSFTPLRDGCHCQWFVDGKDFYAHLADTLELAEVCEWDTKPFTPTKLA